MISETGLHQILVKDNLLNILYSHEEVLIKTERILIRRLALSDVNKRYLSWFSDVETTKFIESKALTMSDLKDYVSSKINSRNTLFLAVVARDKNIHIGNIKFEPIDYEKKWAVLGIMIGDSGYHGKGYGREIVIASAQYLFENGIEKVTLGVNMKNSSAVRLYEKIGFKHIEHPSVQIKTETGACMVLTS